ncbi:MAG: hypothetical protein JG768_1392 [Fusobacteriales bacterium]|jgi:uncharacterized protein YcfL|nr:hypothetical protein [Fusobacteriales bacterium]
MRKIFIPLLLSVLLLSGCETLKISAPREKNIILEQKTKNDNIRADKEKKVYYALYGLIPISNNSTEDMLTDVKDNSRVAVTTKYSLTDWLVGLGANIIFPTTIVSRTIEVEVNEPK